MSCCCCTHCTHTPNTPHTRCFFAIFAEYFPPQTKEHDVSSHLACLFHFLSFTHEVTMIFVCDVRSHDQTECIKKTSKSRMIVRSLLLSRRTYGERSSGWGAVGSYLWTARRTELAVAADTGGARPPALPLTNYPTPS